MKFLALTLLICSSLLICACNKSKNETTDSSTVTSDNISKEYTYPFTGELTTKENISNKPFMAIIENSKNSRPQSGLSMADILYETSAEGGIPRFIAVFHKNMPNEIGPIRSIRPYFLTLTKEYSLPFAHCGGSKEALDEIKNDESIMSLNEFSFGNGYYRDSSRIAPHNLYTTSSNILNLMKNNKFNSSPKNFIEYDDNYMDKITSEIATEIYLNPSRLYSTSYKYENGKYKKYMDDELAIDKLTNSPIEFSNIIIQKTDIKIKDSENHLDVNLLGKGDGYLITKGKYIKINWFKASEYSRTILTDLEGNEIKLTPGNTIFNIIDKNSEMSIK